MLINRVLFIVLISTGCVQAQTNCQNILSDAVNRMKNVTGNRFAMEYNVRIKTADGAGDNVTHAAFFIANGKAKFISDDMEVFRDSKSQVAVLKEEKSIVITAPLREETGDIQKQVVSILQDSLLQWLTIKTCETSCDPKNANIILDKIETRLKTPALVMNTGISNLIYWINQKTRVVNRIQIFYHTHPYDVKEIDLEVLRYDTEFSGEAFRGDAYGMAFSSGKQLNKKYKGYTIQDLR